ncbi:MAG: ParB/RepB/Spo0J family partition protein [Oscillospiraceae bacterium]|jgi:ParB family chromosome partitioning protein|nr:ParB/RepB/Spo0J family partition protein [Oscillospiraceae bacterium]
MAIKKTGLGKGLAAIFEENELQEKGRAEMLSISEITSNSKQPRRNFDEESLLELSDSISRHGVLQPLIVRSLGGLDGYEIIAGERRWRASKMLGLNEVPAVILEADDLKAIEIALVENLQREDLNPIEEAKAYKLLMKKFALTQENISKEIGKSRSAIANALRLLSLPEEALVLVEEGHLSVGHAKILLSLRDEEKIKKVAKIAREKGLSIRELEKLCEKENQTDYKIKKDKTSIFFIETERYLRDCLKRKVQLAAFKKGNGVIRIHFKNQKDLMGILKIFDR